MSKVQQIFRNIARETKSRIIDGVSISLRKTAEKSIPPDRSANSWRRLWVDLLLLPNDYLAARRGYQVAFGVSPRLFRPSTFNEHIQRSKLLDRRQIHSIYADKLAVREHAERILGYDYFTKVIWSGHNLADLEWEKLPSDFVLKTNHSWRTQIIVHAGNIIDIGSTIETFEKWLASNHSINTGEHQYRWIPPKVFAEELILKPDGSLPDEYNFLCFHGRAQVIEFHRERFSEHTRAYLNRDFKMLPFTRSGFKNVKDPLEEPPELADMIDIAERLSANEKFLRVDFMYGERAFLAELTLRPGSGIVSLEPPSADLELGKLWSDPRLDLNLSGKAIRVK